MYEGQWPALVARADWLAVQRLLRSPDRKTCRPGRAKHLLSLIARCGKCGGTVAVAYRDGRADYYCRTIGCVRITQRDVDDIAEGVMLDYLARPQVIDTLRAAEQHGDHELSAIRDQLATVRTRHETWPMRWTPELSASCWPPGPNPRCRPRSHAWNNARKNSPHPTHCGA
ncbi:MAG TPA: hypothetical protein VGJ13_03790 [Pseudonocardiaceae bacterium]